ncbi:MAG TPA: CBS domain-containing protein [Caulobacteraceae bacterium]|jgi:CBS domain-containing protein
MLVAQILQDKGNDVFTCAPGDSLARAASALVEKRVGAMVVMAGDRVAGILSERDLVRAMARDGAGCLDRPVEAYMTADVIFARPQETADDLMERMTDRRIRHLPVCENDRLLGIISIGDVVKTKIAETVYEAETLKAYIVSG